MDTLEDLRAYAKVWGVYEKRYMGFLFENCELYATRNYGVEIVQSKFIDGFMNCYLRELMDGFLPRLLSQAASDTFDAYVDYCLEGDFSSIRGKKEEYCHAELSWIGQMYAYAHCMTLAPAKEIYKIVGLETMRKIYITGHTVSWSKAFEIMNSYLNFEIKLY